MVISGADGCWCVMASWIAPTSVDALERCDPAGLQLDPLSVSYLLSREKLVSRSSEQRRRTKLRDALFAGLERNARSVTDYFNIPPNQVVKLGSRVEI